VQISDGAVQTSGVSIRVVPQGGAAAAGLGTTSYEDGVVLYAPTQAETNYEAFAVIAYKTGCIPAATTVVTSDTATAGRVRLSGETHSGATIPTVTTITNAVTAGTVSDKTGYSLASNGLASVTAWTVAITGNITGNVSGSVASVTGAVGSVTGNVGGSVASVVGNVGGNVTGSVGSVVSGIPTAGENADAVWDEVMSGHTTAGTYGGRLPRSDTSSVEVKITGSKHLAADVHELQPAVIQATHFDLGAIDANALAADAAAEIAAAVWSAATRTLTAFSFAITVDAASIRSAIGMASANLDTQLDAIPTAAEIDTQLTASHGAGSWAVGGTGSGAFTLTLTVNDGTSPLENATVRMVEGVNAYVGQTNASGVVAFSLDAATYSVAITKDGYSFTPTTKVVSATGSQTYSMTQITPTIPAAAGLSTGTAVCYGTTGLPIAGVVVTIQQIDGKGVAGSAYDGDTFTLTSNAQGVISHNGFVRGAVYSIRRGIRGEVKSFVVPDAASFDLSEIVGRD
jgi:hypothetical protein